MAAKFIFVLFLSLMLIQQSSGYSFNTPMPHYRAETPWLTRHSAMLTKVPNQCLTDTTEELSALTWNLCAIHCLQSSASCNGFMFEEAASKCILGSTSGTSFDCDAYGQVDTYSLPDVGQPDYCGVGWDLCTLSNTCIKVVHELQNLEGANATCVSYAGRLIEITSADIQSWLEEYLSALEPCPASQKTNYNKVNMKPGAVQLHASCQVSVVHSGLTSENYLIGLMREAGETSELDVWNWIGSGDPVSYTNWQDGSPSDQGSAVVLRGTFNSKWTDESNQSELGCICERIPDFMGP